MKIPKQYHPEGMAALIAVIVAPLDVADLPLDPSGKKTAMKKAVDRHRDRVLQMAAQFYKINPCDFDNTVDWHIRQGASANNLAKLDRRNIS